MQIKYKKVKQLMPHCGDCGELLGGNGSDLFPYRCTCGQWELCIDDEKNFEYKLKKYHSHYPKSK